MNPQQLTSTPSKIQQGRKKTLDPLAGSPATGKFLAGIINLFVDDLFGTSGNRNGSTRLDQK